MCRPTVVRTPSRSNRLPAFEGRFVADIYCARCFRQFLRLMKGAQFAYKRARAHGGNFSLEDCMAKSKKLAKAKKMKAVKSTRRMEIKID